MSTITAYAGRHRLPALFVVIAIAAAIAVSVLVVVNTPGSGSAGEVQAPAGEVQAPPDYVPTPEWLDRYLEYDAEAPYWQRESNRPPNEGLR